MRMTTDLIQLLSKNPNLRLMGYYRNRAPIKGLRKKGREQVLKKGMNLCRSMQSLLEVRYVAQCRCC